MLPRDNNKKFFLVCPISVTSMLSRNIRYFSKRSLSIFRLLIGIVSFLTLAKLTYLTYE